MSILDKREILKESRMFFGDGHFVQEFITPKYPWAAKSAQQQEEQNWAHDEYTLTLDAAQLSSSNQAIRHIFTSNLQSQIAADSIQGRGPAWLIPYITDPSLEEAFIQWARYEIKHSKTYSYMLSSMYPNPSLIINMIDQKPEIFVRFKRCIDAYDTFFLNPNKKNLVILVAAINILEGLSFYASFICNFSFANMGLFESVAKFLRLIMKDEDLHLAITQNIIKTWKDGKDGNEWKDLWIACKDEITEMWVDSIKIEQEVWSPYLFKYGTPIAGLNEKLLNASIEFYGNKRMKNIGLKPYSKLNKDPLPWMQSKFISNKARMDAPQEVQLSEYLLNPIERLTDLSRLESLFQN